MTIISLTDCCHLLAIDPKTLRHWMGLSHLETLPHPLDARRKCLTREQLQQLAVTHRRTLEPEVGLRFQPETSSLSTPTNVMSATVLPDVRSDWGVAHFRMILPLLGLLLRRLMSVLLIRKRATPPDFSGPITDLTKQLASLQAHVAILQHQLTLLNSQLQNEQQWRASVASTGEEKSVELSLESSQDLSLEKSVEPSLESPRDLSLESSQDLSLEKSVEPSRQEKQARTATNVFSTGQRKPSHVLPWVEYGAQGKYVVISPQRGLLEFEPDSPEWFAWLSTLPSFRFMGKLGRFTAHRGGSTSPERSWRASRHIRNRSYNQSLGKTESLTIANLEQVAATLQSHLN